MQILTGDTLKTYCTDALTTRGIRHQRRQWKALHSYCKGRNDGKLMSLYGLRRTGKSTLILQEIVRLGDYDHTALFICSPADADKVDDFLDYIEDHPEKRYIFADEVTFFQDFLSTANILSDRYALAGQKIILAGTDSLAFKIASMGILYDRTHLLHTTYVPYPEFHALFKKDLDEYIEYGGTLTDGHQVYNQQDRLAGLITYTNTAIADNIEHTLRNWDGGRHSMHLQRILDKGELKDYIFKNVQHFNRTFLYSTAAEMFRSADFHTAASIARQNPDEVPREMRNLLKDPERSAQLQKVLGIKGSIENLGNEQNDEATEQVKSYLDALDVIRVIPNRTNRHDDEVLFIQPGLRYCLFEEARSQLLDDDDFLAFDDKVQDFVLSRMEENVKGHILEEMIYYQLMTDEKINQQYTVGRHRDRYGFTEVDCLLIDRDTKDIILMEVKHSKTRHDNQVRHLLNEDGVCRPIERRYGGKVVGKAVIYRGQNFKAKNGVFYTHAENFLCRPNQEIKKIITHYKNYIKKP